MLETLEDRVTPSTLYIDQPGDFTITGDQGVIGVLDNGDQVVWNPGAPAATVPGLIFGTNAFGTIQSAVAAAVDGDTLIAGNGTYVENVSITVDLTLRSANGRAFTTIQGISGAGSLGAVVVSNHTTGTQIGGSGQGFTIVGVDNGNPAIENAAVYAQGGHDRLKILDNELVAAGDSAFTADYGTTNTGWVIDGNIFSGKTFVGAQPADNGFANQFSTPNVPRQLVVIGTGGGPVASGTGLSSNITFTNNQLIGITGGTNGGGEQGTSLATIDAGNSTITGNTFAGTTTRFGSALRVRRPNTVISGNTFDTSNMSVSTNSLFVQNNITPLQNIVPNNTFDRGAFLLNGDTVWQVIQAPLFAAANTGSTVVVLPGTYTENVVVNNLGGTLTAVTINAPSGGVNVNPAGGNAFTVPTGVTATFTGAYITSQPVQVDGGGTLAGTASFTGPVNVSSGGTLSPGPLTGIVGTGNLNLAAGSTFQAEVNSATPGTGYDQVNVTGTVNLAGANLVTSGTIAANPGVAIVLIANDGADPVQGSFAGLPEGSVVTINGVNFTLSYKGGDGNDVTLAVPVDVSVTKTSVATTIAVGTQFTYTITATNSGSAVANGVKLADIFPTALANVTWTSQASGGATGNTAAGAGNLNETLNLPVGSSVVYTVTATLAVPTSLTLANTATLTTGAGITDTNPADNTATETDDVWFHPAFALNPVPDLYTPHPNASSNQAFIQGLYHQVLGREGSAGEVDGWVQQLNAGLSRDVAVNAFVNSQEHRQEQVEYYYQTFLGRTAVGDPGATGWVNLLLATHDESQVITGILTSAEFTNAHSSNADFVTQLYQQLLGREPDAGGLASWEAQLAGGASRASVVQAFLHSAEGAGLATESLYVGYFHRPSDAGSAAAEAALQSGSLTYSALMISFLSSAENSAQAAQNVP